MLIYYFPTDLNPSVIYTYRWIFSQNFEVTDELWPEPMNILTGLIIGKFLVVYV